MPKFDLLAELRGACERDRDLITRQRALDLAEHTPFTLSEAQAHMHARTQAPAYGYTAAELTQAIYALFGAQSASVVERTRARGGRIHATVAWVRASCERDGYPDWLTELVIARVQDALLADDFPLVADEGR